MDRPCYCDSQKTFKACCEPLIRGEKEADSALELMRSRYSAYVLKAGEYLYKTCSNQLKNSDDIEAIKRDKTQWLGLKVEYFSENEVHFMAYYKVDEKILVMKEHSMFIREEGAWRYDSGEVFEGEIGRNEPCPCGSGKKYKKCCA